MVKTHARFLAIEMRKAGHSYNYIAPKVGVSKSTLSIWLADVPYTPNLATINRIGKARAASVEVKRRLKQETFERAKKEAQNDVQSVSTRDLFMLGLGLYIGEGAKSPSATSFVNSNLAIMNLIIRWFTESIGLPKRNLRMRLHVYPDTDQEQSLEFWSSQTGLSEDQFFRPVVDVRKDKKANKSGKLPYGTAHLTVKSLGEKRFGVFLARKILAWSDRVLGTEEIAGLV
ncbi:MAG: hypothetical protein A2854_03325 [Parcubacteria group bacterium RIFCSPHIGHO2_01_FULL_56_18]|nr:MAG: hypothetical protein A2854_03325 [Parcubacteria group bacterium RIFCSPHIGHO2_01_FULL_56_18]